MKTLFVVLLGVTLLTSACAPVYGPPAYAPAYGAGPVYGAQPVVSGGYVVSVEDRPYYTRGPYYVHSGVRYVWAPGHWTHRHGRRVWVHGKYVIRG